MIIRTTFVQATDTRGERIRARAKVGVHTYTTTVPYDYALNAEDNHREAAMLLVAKVRPTSAPVKLIGDHPKGYIYEVALSSAFTDEAGESLDLPGVGA